MHEGQIYIEQISQRLIPFLTARQFNKHSYGSHLCLFLYLHSTVAVHLPVPEKDLQPCIFTRMTYIWISQKGDNHDCFIQEYPPVCFPLYKS